MAKQKLVVVGNGMAGARAVEEVLARGGGDQFDIVMFGDEPYGNYNRILLSNVLSGAQDRTRSSSIRSTGTRKTTSRCMPARGSSTSTGPPKSSSPESGKREHYDKLLIATGSRAFIPPMTGAHLADGELKARRVRLPHARRLQRHRSRTPSAASTPS